MAPSFRSTRLKVEAVERHCDGCAQCDRALRDSPVGRYLMCLEGDHLVADVYRDVYARHMEAAKRRREHFRTRRDPFGEASDPSRRA